MTGAQTRRNVILGVLLLTALGAAIRCFRLGYADTRADEVELIEFLQRGVGPIEYFKHTFEQFQAGRQLPLPRVATSAYVLGLGLEVNLFNVRTPFALLSSTVPIFLVYLGRRWWGPRLGWILGFLGAISPYAVYWSRVAHVYGFVIPLVVATTALFVPVLRAAAEGRRPPAVPFWGATLAAVLAAYSHLSPWPLAGLLWLTTLVLYLRRNAWRPSAVPRMVWFGLFLWIVPLAPWAWMFVTAMTEKWDMLSVVTDNPLNRITAMWRLPFVMSWGGGWIGGLLSLGLPIVGVGLAFRRKAARAEMGLLLALGAALAAALAITIQASGGIFTIRYLSALWIFWLLLDGVGVYELANLCTSRRIGANACAAVLCAGVAAHAAAPLWWIGNLQGHPTPYTRVNQWMDANLPPGTPVVVDRWYEPMHEMRFHAPSNVVVTFTVPNEPLKTFLELRWRDTVRRFMERFPDAAYLELIKCYFYVPTVGWWHWPREYFARHVAITNEPALNLRRRLLAPTEDYYVADTNRIVVEIFYNTVSDHLARARAADLPLFRTYGPGWKYTKTRDFRDWRVLEDAAVTEVYNLTEEPRDVEVILRGVAVDGAKRVRLRTGESETFPAQQMHEWRIILRQVPPGRTELRWEDPFWSTARSVLLVDEVAVR